MCIFRRSFRGIQTMFTVCAWGSGRRSFCQEERTELWGCGVSDNCSIGLHDDDNVEDCDDDEAAVLSSRQQDRSVCPLHRGPQVRGESCDACESSWLVVSVRNLKVLVCFRTVHVLSTGSGSAVWPQTPTGWWEDIPGAPEVPAPVFCGLTLGLSCSCVEEVRLCPCGISARCLPPLSSLWAAVSVRHPSTRTWYQNRPFPTDSWYQNLHLQLCVYVCHADPGGGRRRLRVPLPAGRRPEGSDPMYITGPQHAAAQHQQLRVQGTSLNAAWPTALERGALTVTVFLCLQVLTVGGSSSSIDVFTNMSYRAFSLRFWSFLETINLLL